jgi:hypothetical protein
MIRAARESWGLLRAGLNNILGYLLITVTIGSMIGFAIQTVRLSGLQITLPLVGTLGPEGCESRVKRLAIELEDLKFALGQSETMHTMEKERREAANEQLRREIDHTRKAEEALQLALARSFIARGGVQPKGSGDPDPRAPSASEGGGSGSAERSDRLSQLDGVRLVSVLPRDVEICTINTTRLQAGQRWAIGIESLTQE